MTVTLESNLGDDLRITKVVRRTDGGVWISGRIADHRFEALAFPGHADDPEFELGDSRISKLWVSCDQRTVFNWDRGLDVTAKTEAVQALVDFLTAGLAEHTFATAGEARVAAR